MNQQPTTGQGIEFITSFSRNEILVSFLLLIVVLLFNHRQRWPKRHFLLARLAGIGLMRSSPRLLGRPNWPDFNLTDPKFPSTDAKTPTAQGDKRCGRPQAATHEE